MAALDIREGAFVETLHGLGVVKSISSDEQNGTINYSILLDSNIENGRLEILPQSQIDSILPPENVLQQHVMLNEAMTQTTQDLMLTEQKCTDLERTNQSMEQKLRAADKTVQQLRASQLAGTGGDPSVVDSLFAMSPPIGDDDMQPDMNVASSTGTALGARQVQSGKASMGQSIGGAPTQDDDSDDSSQLSDLAPDEDDHDDHKHDAPLLQPSDSQPSPLRHCYCLVYARQTGQFITSIQNGKIIPIKREEFTGHKKLLCIKLRRAVKTRSGNSILASLEKGGLKYTCWYSKDAMRKYIYAVVSCPVSMVEDWADVKSIPLGIHGENAVRYGRKNEAFALAHRTHLPDDRFDKFHSVEGTSEVLLDKLDLKLWKDIHIAYDASVPREVFRVSPDGCKMNNRMFLRMVYQIITEGLHIGGCNVNVNRQMSRINHPLKEMFALHTDDKPIAHTSDVFRLERNLWKTKISEIRNYFGELIGFYFGFLAHFTKWMIFIAPLGIFWFIVQQVTDDYFPKGTPFVLIIYFLWATILTEMWYRRENKFRYIWGMLKYRSSVTARPEFRGDLSISRVTGETEVDHWSRSWRTMKILFSLGSIILTIAIVIFSVFGIWVLKQLFNENTEFSVIIGIINSIQIQVYNYCFVFLAHYLNNFENHRYHVTWYNHYIIKRMFFFIVNSFNSLFYLAFYYTKWDSHLECLNAVRTQLLTLFFTAIIVQNSMEILVPKLIVKIKEKWEERAANRRENEGMDTGLLQDTQTSDYLYVNNDQIGITVAPEDEDKVWGGSDPSISPREFLGDDYARIVADIEYQVQQDRSPSVLDNTAEIVIQYGYVSLFFVVFPIMPVLSIVNNFFEFAVDFHNYTHLQRPVPHAAPGIGVWKTVWSTFSLVAVFSNLAILTWRSDTFNEYTFANGDSDKRTEFFLVTCFSVLVGMFLIRYVIDDTPKSIEDAVGRQEVVEKYLLGGEGLKSKLRDVLKKKREEHDRMHSGDGKHTHDHGHSHGDEHDHKTSLKLRAITSVKNILAKH